MAGNCSAAINAACHPPDGEKDAGSTLVKWGEVMVIEGGEGNQGGEYKHCSFSSGDVGLPRPGILYLSMSWD